MYGGAYDGHRLRRFAQGVRRVAPRVNRYLKDNRLISRGLVKLLPMAGEFSPLVAGASLFAEQMGYGYQRGGGRYLAGYSRYH